MSNLEEYLVGEHHSDSRDIEEIEKLLNTVAKTFTVYFRNRVAWPYSITTNGPEWPKKGKLSHNTTAMILGALMCLRDRFVGGVVNDSKDVPRGSIFPLADAIDDKVSDAIDRNIDLASKRLLREVVRRDGTLCTDSTTFGEDDVFTLAWLSEIGPRRWLKGNDQEKWQGVERAVFRKTKRLLKVWEKTGRPPALFEASKHRKFLDHAFPPLRLVQAYRRISGPKLGPLSSLYGFFEGILHDQLSFSAIPDSRFDPAELTFCLEGMLLCQHNVVDRSLFDRVFSVLQKAQIENAYWRPVKPVLATPQGHALFPVSIEVANSLLRSCKIFDGNDLHNTYGSKCILLLRRYWQWLRARTVKFTSGDVELVGWHSEHVNEPEVIHLWETSQVIEFLLAYRNALHMHIARTTLVGSRFQQQTFKIEQWDDLQKTFESAPVLGEAGKVYSAIGKAYVEPHKQKGAENFSILLYGPAGTGKTTVAECIAKALQRRLVTITVSDFLSGGEAQLEARAKNIFSVLEAQPETVVLFDEIDNFLLDRDSEWYRDQSTVFKFITPGMLTKLNNLRRSKRVIFIVATNYEDRIDPAIKRTGRIDNKYLVLPPDSKKRKAILVDLLKEKNLQLTARGRRTWKDLEAASLFLGYKDMEAVIQKFGRSSPIESKELISAFQARSRTTSLEAYDVRFRIKDETYRDIGQTPIGEFLCLLALHLESGRQLSVPQLKVVKAAAAVVRKANALDIKARVDATHLESHVPHIHKIWLAKMAQALTVNSR